MRTFDGCGTRTVLLAGRRDEGWAGRVRGRDERREPNDQHHRPDGGAAPPLRASRLRPLAARCTEMGWPARSGWRPGRPTGPAARRRLVNRAAARAVGLGRDWAGRAESPAP